MNGQSQTILAGYLGAWMYQALGGINYDPNQPGFKHIILKPHPVGDLTWAKASYNSVYGRIASEWAIKDGQFRWTVVVPPNTTATAYIPTTAPDRVLETGKPIHRRLGIRVLEPGNATALVKLGSGTYEFAAPFEE
jgi:alpha-L-rhamnosidase